MAVHPKIQALNNYLIDPKVNGIPLIDTSFNFFISYLGNQFIQGYRIFEYLSHNYTLVLQLAQQQKYRFVHYEMDIISDRTKRQEIWRQLMQLVELIHCEAEVHVVYLKCQKYSIMNLNELKNSRLPDTHSYPQTYSFLPFKRGYKHIDVKEEGTKLHGMIEYFLKGQTFIHNQDSFNRQITGRDGEIKFSYELNKIINTLKLIVGRQVLENNYHVMSSQKWMRKKTKKSFKRFDLILRNENKICIIDWKFSRISAHEKINTRAFVKKNELYLQLAKKDYKSDVELKFYCIHIDYMLDHYHKFTEAYYDYKIDEIMIEEENKEEDENDEDEIVFFDGQAENFVETQGQTNTQKVKNNPIQDFRLRHGLAEEKTQQNLQKNFNSVKGQDQLSLSQKRPYPLEPQKNQLNSSEKSLQTIIKKKHKPDPILIQQNDLSSEKQTNRINTKQNNPPKGLISKTHKKIKIKKKHQQQEVILIEEQDDKQDSDDDVVFIENIPQDIGAIKKDKTEKDSSKLLNQDHKSPQLDIDSKDQKNRYYISLMEEIDIIDKQNQEQKTHEINNKNQLKVIESEKQKQRSNKTQEQLSQEYEEINFQLLDAQQTVMKPNTDQEMKQSSKNQQKKPQIKTNNTAYRSYIVVSSGQEDGEMFL